MAAASVLVLAGCSRPAAGPPDPTAPRVAPVSAERKDFVSTLRLHGTVEAVRSWVVAAPRLAGAAASSLVVTKLVTPGTEVEAGDLLVELDRQGQLKTAQDRRSDYLDLVAQIQKKQAEQDVARAADETALEQAEHDVGWARLKILKNEMLSKIAAEKNEQALEEAEATLKQLRATFELKRLAARAELKTLEIQRDRALDAARHAETNATSSARRAHVRERTLVRGGGAARPPTKTAAGSAATRRRSKWPRPNAISRPSRCSRRAMAPSAS